MNPTIRLLLSRCAQHHEAQARYMRKFARDYPTGERLTATEAGFISRAEGEAERHEVWAGALQATLIEDETTKEEKK